MATNVIMPVLGMVQDTGKIVRWLKSAGEAVSQGELLLEIETDKAVQELEAPASGILARVLAQEGDDVPVTQVVAVILTLEEYQSTSGVTKLESPPQSNVATKAPPEEAPTQASVTASPLAERMARENKLDLTWIKPQGGRVEKSDVLVYLAKHKQAMFPDGHEDKVLASPKARRLARETNQNLAALRGSGPNGAIRAQDLERNAANIPQMQSAEPVNPTGLPIDPMPEVRPVSEPLISSTIWQRMAKHTTNSWTAAPHFYLQRTVRAARLLAWHAHLLQQNYQPKITITDLLILITSRALLRHPNINVVWQAEQMYKLNEINISLAVALDDGLVVPVIHHADRLSAWEITKARKELLARAGVGKLRLDDISGGTFTISNLGMYGVDSFNAVLNGPQAAILAVGRIVEQVIPVNGVALIQPTMSLSVTFDHRAVDGANGAKFLQTLAELIEEPLAIVS